MREVGLGLPLAYSMSCDQRLARSHVIVGVLHLKESPCRSCDGYFCLAVSEGKHVCVASKPSILLIT